MSHIFNGAEFAAGIKKFRLSAGYSQKALGDLLHVTPQTVSKWEKGIAYPDIENFTALSRALHTTPNELLNFNGDEKGKYYIGIDGGGTKTEFVLADADGNIKKRVILGGSNPNVISVDASLAILMEGIDICLSEVSGVEGIYIGAAGVASGLNMERMLPKLKKKYWGSTVSLNSDIENVILASGYEKGLAVILGTGFIIYEFDGDERFRIGGIGYLFEGGGSGYDIGHDAVRYALQAENGLLKTSVLYGLITDKLAEDFPAFSQKSRAVFDYIDNIYQGGNDYIASFTPLVFKAYSKGDPFAEEILRKNIQAVEEMVRYGLKKSGKNSPVVLMGGLTKERAVFMDLFSKDLHPNLSFLDLPPVYGAVLGAIAESSENKFRTQEEKEVFTASFMLQYNQLVNEHS